MDLFEQNETFEFVPLAEKMRPKTLDDFFGQEHIVGEGSPIREMIQNDAITSMIFWGPPGVGDEHILTKIECSELEKNIVEGKK